MQEPTQNTKEKEESLGVLLSTTPRKKFCCTTTTARSRCIFRKSQVNLYLLQLIMGIRATMMGPRDQGKTEIEASLETIFH